MDARIPFETLAVGPNGDWPNSLPVSTGMWLIPDEVKLDGDWLLWKPAKFIGKRRMSVELEPGLLKKFCALADAPDERIASFAAKWGVLFLCEHNFPVRHLQELDYPSIFPNTNVNSAVTMPGYHVRDSTPCCWLQRLPHNPDWYAEKLRGWRGWANHARAILSIAANLNMDKAGKFDDWYTLTATGSDIASPNDPLRIERARIMADDSKGGIVFQEIFLSSEVNQWLSWGDVRPALPAFAVSTPEHFWDMFRLELKPNAGLFGALAIQLAAAVTRSGGFAVCVACGSFYSPTRKPQAGRRTFCDKCRGPGTYARYAMRDYLRRKRERQQSKQQPKEV